MCDWERVMERLRSYSPGVNVLRDGCNADRIAQISSELGSVPPQLRELLRHFNGAELFVDAIPLVTLLGIPLASDRGGAGRFIDHYTQSWRREYQRPHDWVIGIKNYGALIVLSDDGLVREWEPTSRAWGNGPWRFEEWIETLLVDGDAYLRS